MISKETAQGIALAYREIETAEALLFEIKDALSRRATPDFRDAFGRQRGLELGVPSGPDNSRRIFNLEWTLAAPIIEAHIANQKAIVSALTEKAKTEIAH